MARCADVSLPSRAARGRESRPRPSGWPARLRSHAIAVVVTREPGGSAGADIMRHVLLSGAAKPLGPLAETLLFAAARDDHIRATIAAGPRRRQMGRVRPLHRLDPRLPGRAGRGRRQADPRPRAPDGGRRDAGSHPDPRPAARDRPGARRPPQGRPAGRPVRERDARFPHASCAGPTATSPPASPSAAC